MGITCIFFLKNKRYTTRGKLKDFHEQVNSAIFEQVHRRYLVNFNFVEMVGSDFIGLNEQKLPLSDTHKSRVKKRFE